MKKYTFIMSIILAFFSKSMFAQWETVSYGNYGPPFHIISNAIDFYTYNNGYVVGNNCKVLKTLNGGDSWTLVPFAPLSVNFTDVVFASQSTIVIVGESSVNSEAGIITCSNDDGVSWTTLTTSNNLYSVCFPSGSVGFTVGDSGTVYKTVNGANSWNLINTGSVTNFRSVSFVNDTIGFICGGDEVLKTTDGGITWVSQTINDGTGFFLNNITFPSDSVGYCKTIGCGNNGNNVFKTTDQGVNWSLIHNSSGLCTSTITFINNETGYIVGQFYVAKTTDGGLTWNEQTASTPSSYNFMDDLMDVKFLNKDTGFIVGPEIFYRTFSGGVTNSIRNVENENIKLKCIPNPAKNNLELEIRGKDFQKATVLLVNIHNETILEKVYYYNSKILFDVSNLPSGIYIARVILDDKSTMNQKISVVK